eukprot:CAMPEP_0169254134 /NCGR_PEP_ID=MMETSP1016-20121227/39003_1 /TAXON_ID=342587 /ORGANISM="Karlodinium micrum, Strain CCMP2283" /LENGTH=167 /DNA_ID=CAMNT_0009335555 /DNA_START=76 /DNA_END=576 /DNA_ORIENTATION=-
MTRAISFHPVSCSACKRPQHCSEVETVASFDSDTLGHRCSDGVLQEKPRRFRPGASSRCVAPPPLLPPSDESASTASAGDMSSVDDFGDSSKSSACSVGEEGAANTILSMPQFKPRAFKHICVDEVDEVEVDGLGNVLSEPDLSSALLLSFLTRASLATEGQHLCRW